MELHHTKHHQTYVNGLNAAEEAYFKAPSTREKIALQTALKFNGGGKSPSPPVTLLPHLSLSRIGHINHTLFWKNLAPVKEGGGKLKDGKLKHAIERDFGSVEVFKKQFNAATAAIQGSGWGWLAYNPTVKILEIVTTANQDPLLGERILCRLFAIADQSCQAHVPIIGIDIWEHVRRYSSSHFYSCLTLYFQAFYLQVRCFVF
jgi:Fe-Mn family superoxide dismutase